MEPIQRMVRWFEKDPGDALVGEIELNGISLAELQQLFGVPTENPMYDCWLIRPEHVPALSRYLPIPIDLSQYVWFVETE